MVCERWQQNPLTVRLAQRHAGEDIAILQARHEPYQKARQKILARWSRHTRNWTVAGPVTLNPEREEVVQAHIQNKTQKQFVA